MKTVTEQMADALRAVIEQRDYHAEHGSYRPGTMGDDQCFDDWAADIAETVLAAYDAQQAQAVAAGAWVAEPITNVVSAPPLPRRAYREPVATCNSAEYAERIVACVNACAGMTTAEVLEFGAPGELGRCAQAWVAEDNDNA